MQRAIISEPRALAKWRTCSSSPGGLSGSEQLARETALLSEWIHCRDGQGAPTCPSVTWLSLDERPDDPMRFLAYVITALTITVASSGDGPVTTALTGIVADQAALRVLPLTPMPLRSELPCNILHRVSL